MSGFWFFKFKRRPKQTKHIYFEVYSSILYFELVKNIYDKHDKN
jgi:hypothetical protein